MDKKKILDVRIPKEEQENSPKLIAHLAAKKYQVTVEDKDGKIRYAYGDDPVILEMACKSWGFTILKTTKL